MSQLTREIFCSTTPVHPDDRKPLWDERMRQERINQLVDRIFPRRHPVAGSLSVLSRVRAFFKSWRFANGR